MRSCKNNKRVRQSSLGVWKSVKKKESSFSLFFVFLVSFFLFVRAKIFLASLWYLRVFRWKKRQGNNKIPPFFYALCSRYGRCITTLKASLSSSSFWRRRLWESSVVLILLLFQRAKSVPSLSERKRECLRELNRNVIPITFCRHFASDASHINSLTNALILFIFLKPAAK